MLRLFSCVLMLIKVYKESGLLNRHIHFKMDWAVIGQVSSHPHDCVGQNISVFKLLLILSNRQA